MFIHAGTRSSASPHDPTCSADDAPTAGWFVHACLALFAFGIAMDGTIATSLGSGGQQSFLTSAVLAAPLVVPSGWHVLAGNGIRRPPLSFLAIGIFVAWCALSVFWVKSDSTTTGVALMTRVQLLIFVWLAYQIVRSRDELRVTMAGYVLGCCVLAALTWRNYLLGTFVIWDRYAADGFDPNDMAMYLALGIPMAAYLTLSRGPRRHARKLWLVYLPLALSGVVLSGSRGGVIAAAAAVAVVVVWLVRRNITALVLATMLVASALTVALPWIPGESLDRILTTRQQLVGDADKGGRTEIWDAGMMAFPQHPIIGAGLGEFADAALPYMTIKIVAHSTPLQIGVELGVIGLLLFFGAFALAMAGARRSGRDERALVYGLIATLLVGIQGLSFDDRKPLWLVLLIAMAAAGLLQPVRTARSRA